MTDAHCRCAPALTLLSHARPCSAVLRLKTGWSYCRERTSAGSLMQIAWTSDGTQLVGAGGNGTVLFAQLVQRHLEWNHFEVTLTSPKEVHVQDVSEGVYETLEFPRERVVEMSLAYGHFVVATATQCFIYSVTNWNTPHIFDMSAAVSLIMLCEKHFLMVDTNGVGIYSYEGRPISSPRFQGLRAEFLNVNTMALSNDCVAILDASDRKKVRCFDTQAGRPMQELPPAKLDIVQLALSQHARGVSERRLAYIDRNRDLYLCAVMPQPGMARRQFKLQTQVDTIAWNDKADMLCAIADSRFICWYYPNVASIDRDLLPQTMAIQDATEFGKVPQLLAFHGARATVRRADGALLTAQISPYPLMLHALVGAAPPRWDEAQKLCRHAKDDRLWAVLAATAVQANNLDAAEIAFAAIKEVDKLQFMLHIKSLATDTQRQAELMLYRRCPDEAEAILLQAQPPLVFHAIKLNIRLFRWERALDLALEKQSNVDTVLAYRTRYLKAFSKMESDARFVQIGKEVSFDWDTINAKRTHEGDDSDDDDAKVGFGPIGGGGGGRGDSDDDGGHK